MLFSLIWLVIIYAGNCAVARRFILPRWQTTGLYVIAMIALGLTGEIIFDTTYTLIVGQPLWEYRVAPIHHGYTSLYSLFIWALIGLHLSLLHTTLNSRGTINLHRLAFLFCTEAIVLEAAGNASHLLLFDEYIYYYLPGDLWHLTSLQALPLYLSAGYITVFILSMARKTPRTALAGSAVITCAAVTTGILRSPLL